MIETSHIVSVATSESDQWEPEALVLPTFKPISARFPAWKTAQVVISTSIPDSLEFRVDRRAIGRVALNIATIEKLPLAAPEEYRNDVFEMVTGLCEIWPSRVLHVSAFDWFLNRPMTQRSLGEMNEMLCGQERTRQYFGLPTSVEIMKHMLGVEPAPSAFSGCLRFNL